MRRTIFGISLPQTDLVLTATGHAQLQVHSLTENLQIGARARSTPKLSDGFLK